MKSSSRLGTEWGLAPMVVGACLFLYSLGLAGCAMLPVAPTVEPAPTAAPGEALTAAAIPTGAAEPGDAAAAIRAAWASAAHASSFVADDKGQNNDCARCHSPLNWTPTSSADLPMQCTSCKFNVPKPKPVAEAEWKSVGCEVCHRTEDHVVRPEVAWLNSLVAQYQTDADPYEPVQMHTELCEKCHRDQGAVHARRDLGSGAHAGYECTNCHDAHSAKASCTAEGCHPDALTPAQPIAGHDKDHAAVACAACHDASGLKVAPVDGKAWMPFREAHMPGKTGAVPYVSHALQGKVDCARCHYNGNPWQLRADKG